MLSFPSGLCCLPLVLCSKSANVSANVLAVLGSVVSECLDLVGVYFSGKPSIAEKKRARLHRPNKQQTNRYRTASTPPAQLVVGLLIPASEMMTRRHWDSWTMV